MAEFYLPDELWLDIIERAQGESWRSIDYNTLAQLCLVSKRFCGLTQALLYQSPLGGDLSRAVGRFRTLGERPDLAQCVQNLDFYNWEFFWHAYRAKTPELAYQRAPLCLQEVHGSLQRALQWTSIPDEFQGEISRALNDSPTLGGEHDLALLLLLSPKVRRLGLWESPRGEFIFQLFNQAIQTLATTSEEGLASMNQPLLCLKEIYAHNVDIDKIGPILAHPGLQYLRLYSIPWSNAESDQLELPVNLKILEIVVVIFNEIGLAGVLRRCKKLETLHMYREDIWHVIDMTETGVVLRRDGQNLINLTLCDANHLSLFSGEIGSLCELKRLKTLYIDYRFLVGGQRANRNHADSKSTHSSLAQCLPTSLEALTLTMLKKTRSHRLRPELADLMACDRFTQLRYINVVAYIAFPVGTRRTLENIGWNLSRSRKGFFYHSARLQIFGPVN